MVMPKMDDHTRYFSCVQVLEYKKRDTSVDNALFGFFRKQAVKSLKRNFSDFCRDVSTSNKARRFLHFFFYLLPTVFLFLIIFCFYFVWFIFILFHRLSQTQQVVSVERLSPDSH
jgi:hypothetical protein